MVTTPLLPLEPDIGILREGTRSFWPQISPDKLPPVKDPVKPVVRQALAETPAVERGQEEEEEEHEGAEKALLRLPRRRPPPPPPPLGRRAPQDKIREGTVTSMARWWRAVVRRNGAFSLRKYQDAMCGLLSRVSALDGTVKFVQILSHLLINPTIFYYFQIWPGILSF